MASLPVYPWRLAPEGLATRRQLRAQGLRPGGQEVVAQLERPRRRRGPLVAYLYRIEDAKPVRPMTSRKWGALALAMLARRTCPRCRLDVGYCIPTSHGVCGTCLAAEEQRAA
ncbi:RRQRL motif-containing zinc-binding protein [Streptomyces sp. NPDC002491]